MPKLVIERSIEVTAPIQNVYAIIADLNQWRPWNPWLITEPETRVDVSPNGKSYQWQGQITGSGQMQIVSEREPHSVRLELTFVKPFKSKAQVHFELEPSADGCLVNWGMRGSLPFFLFFLTKTMTKVLGMDYDRGLLMLKDFVEAGSVPSRIEVKGESSFPGCRYVGIDCYNAISDLGEQMLRDFDKLRIWQQATGTKLAGDAFCIYRKWEIVAGRVRYTIGVPVHEPPARLPSGLVHGEIPELKTFVLDHVGAYRHLANAWSAVEQMSRGKIFHPSRAFPPFETYPRGPDGMIPNGDSDAHTRTQINVPRS